MLDFYSCVRVWVGVSEWVDNGRVDSAKVIGSHASRDAENSQTPASNASSMKASFVKSITGRHTPHYFHVPTQSYGISTYTRLLNSDHPWLGAQDDSKPLLQYHHRSAQRQSKQRPWIDSGVPIPHFANTSTLCPWLEYPPTKRISVTAWSWFSDASHTEVNK